MRCTDNIDDDGGKSAQTCVGMRPHPNLVMYCRWGRSLYITVIGQYDFSTIKFQAKRHEMESIQNIIARREAKTGFVSWCHFGHVQRKRNSSAICQFTIHRQIGLHSIPTCSWQVTAFLVYINLSFDVPSLALHPYSWYPIVPIHEQELTNKFPNLHLCLSRWALRRRLMLLWTR